MHLTGGGCNGNERGRQRGGDGKERKGKYKRMDIYTELEAQCGYSID